MMNHSNRRECDGRISKSKHAEAESKGSRMGGGSGSKGGSSRQAGRQQQQQQQKEAAAAAGSSSRQQQAAAGSSRQQQQQQQQAAAALPFSNFGLTTREAQGDALVHEADTDVVVLLVLIPVQYYYWGVLSLPGKGRKAIGKVVTGGIRLFAISR
jgi:hypothetical protein